AIVGTGWCGGIRAETCAAHPLAKSLHLAEIRPERLAEVARSTGAKTAVTDYGALLKMGEIDAVYISATPETTHYPMARAWLARGDGVHARSGLRAVVSRAGETGARIFPGELWRAASLERCADRRHAMDHRYDGLGPLLRRGRRLEPAAGLSEFLDDLDRNGGDRRRAAGGRQPPRRGAEHHGKGHGAAVVHHARGARRSHLRGPDGRRNRPLPRGR